MPKAVQNNNINNPPSATRKRKEADNSTVNHNESGPSKKKRKKKLCSVDECPNQAQNGGVCIRHGATRKIYFCSVAECNNGVINGGVCIRHGAKKKRKKYFCSVAECSNQVQNGGVCTRHGATRKIYFCSVAECPNQAENGGVCVRHGAKTKLCSVAQCTKKAKRRGLCIRHGAYSENNQDVGNHSNVTTNNNSSNSPRGRGGGQSEMGMAVNQCVVEVAPCGGQMARQEVSRRHGAYQGSANQHYVSTAESSDDDEMENTRQSKVAHEDHPLFPLGTKVVKKFEDAGKMLPFKGEVKSYDAKEKLYLIVYEDSDTEELTREEVSRILVTKAVLKGSERQVAAQKARLEDTARFKKKSSSSESEREAHGVKNKFFLYNLETGETHEYSNQRKASDMTTLKNDDGVPIPNTGLSQQTISHSLTSIAMGGEVAIRKSQYVILRDNTSLSPSRKKQLKEEWEREQKFELGDEGDDDEEDEGEEEEEDNDYQQPRPRSRPFRLGQLPQKKRRSRRESEERRIIVDPGDDGSHNGGDEPHTDSSWSGEEQDKGFRVAPTKQSVVIPDYIAVDTENNGKEEIQMLNAELKERKEQVAALETKLEEAARYKFSSESKRAKSQSELNDLRDQLRMKKLELNEISETAAALKQRMDELKVEKEEMRDELQRARMTEASLRSQVEAKCQVIEDLERKLRELTVEIEEATAGNESLQSQLARLLGISKKEAAIAKLERKAKECQESFWKQKEEWKKMNAKLYDAISKLKEKSNAAVELEKTNERLETKLARLEITFEELHAKSVKSPRKKNDGQKGCSSLELLGEGIKQFINRKTKVIEIPSQANEGAGTAEVLHAQLNEADKDARYEKDSSDSRTECEPDLAKEQLMKCLCQHNVDLGLSKIKGARFGAIAMVDIPKGTRLFRCNGPLTTETIALTKDDIAELPEHVQGVVKMYTIPDADNGGVRHVPKNGFSFALGVSWRINSVDGTDFEPNVGVGPKLDESGFAELIALRDIEPGEELLDSYVLGDTL